MNPITGLVKHLTPLPALFSMLAATSASAHPDPEQFVQTAFTRDPVIVDCTLENGDNAQCYEFTVAYLPDTLEIGPFCPSTLDETGGVWDWDGDNAGLYQLNRAFFEMLAEQGYRFYDDDENIPISDPGAGRPEAEHACLSASPDDSVVITMRLPVEPVLAASTTNLGTVAKVGVALDGVPVFADAPSVLDTGHMPALDPCGGHIDPGGWYHWHATSTDVDTVFDTENVDAECLLEQDATALFGYAFDGFPMMGSLESDGSTPSALDACNGHMGTTTAGETYHYHASDEFPNLPMCLSGVVAQNNFSTTAANGIGAAGVGPGRGGQDGGGGRGGNRGLPPGMEEAAEKLGVEPAALLEALGRPGQQPDFKAAASKLGVSEEALRSALPQRRP